MKNKNLKYIIIGLVVGLIVGGVSFSTIQANKKEAEIAYQKDIENQLSIMKFDQEILLGQDDDQEKLSSYRYLLSEQKKYKNNEITDKVILDKYKENVTAARKSFRDNNDSHVEKERTEEGETLEQRIAILGVIKENIEGEQSMMYSKEQKQEVFAKIDTLIKEFEDKINQLKVAKEKKEAEEKEAGEVRVAKVKADETRATSNSGSSNNVSSNNSNSSTSSTSGSYSNNASSKSSTSNNSNNGSSTTQEPSKNPDREYWLTGKDENDPDKNLNWTQSNPDGSVTAGTGDVELGGWEVITK